MTALAAVPLGTEGTARVGGRPQTLTGRPTQGQRGGHRPPCEGTVPSTTGGTDRALPPDTLSHMALGGRGQQLLWPPPAPRNARGGTVVFCCPLSVDTPNLQNGFPSHTGRRTYGCQGGALRCSLCPVPSAPGCRRPCPQAPGADKPGREGVPRGGGAGRLGWQLWACSLLSLHSDGLHLPGGGPGRPPIPLEGECPWGPSVGRVQEAVRATGAGTRLGPKPPV